MKRYLAVVVGLIVLLCAAVGLVPSLRAQVFGVPLRFEWKQGQTQTTRTILEGKAKLEVGGFAAFTLPEAARQLIGQDIPFKVESTSRQFVRSVDAEGNAEVEMTPQGGTVEISRAGKTYKQPIPREAPSVWRVDPRGRVLAGDGKAAGHDKVIGEVLCGFLPGDRRRPGASWSENLDVPLDVENVKVHMKGVVTYHFTGLQTLAGTAQIRSEQDVKIELSMPGVMGVNLEGTLKGTGNTDFDPSKSEITASKGQGELDMGLSVGPMGSSAHLVASFSVRTENVQK
ncbi:MAG: hypothetical protein FJX76_10460 [Armatimonadetes bacterium]|nr:hypothetical protein [Armatimonadota bacterium]